jgi:plasmid stabilization system protein ParE
MKISNPRLEYTPRARQDLRQARHFLRRHSDRPQARVREIIRALRFIREFPKLRPVEGLSLLGLELRYRRAGRFVIVYSYFDPSTSDPDGFVSIRALRHVSEEDVRFGVEEHREFEQDRRPSFLILE